MVKFEEYKPAMAMFGLQFSYAAVALLTNAALIQGMRPAIFVFYRQAIATFVVAPIAYFSSRNKSNECSIGLKSFCLMFVTSLIGVSVNQNIYFAGMYFASSSTATAMANLVPAVTFVVASIFGLERVSLQSWSTVAKIIGTMLCVGGAISMAMLRGPKLLNAQLQPAGNFIFRVSSAGEHWLLGCLLIFGSCWCWSIWLILQVPLSASYPDHLSLSAWLCFMGSLQAGAIAVFSERDLNTWILHSNLELFCCLFAGVIGSGLAFFVQAWCISRRGPLFSAMFNPLTTVMVTILAAIFLHEEIYTGSLVGALGVIMGLYVVLWGKARDLMEIKNDANYSKLQNDKRIQVLIHEALQEESSEIVLEEPLLNHRSNGDDITEDAWK